MRKTEGWVYLCGPAIFRDDSTRCTFTETVTAPDGYTGCKCRNVDIIKNENGDSLCPKAQLWYKKDS